MTSRMLQTTLLAATIPIVALGLISCGPAAPIGQDGGDKPGETMTLLTPVTQPTRPADGETPASQAAPDRPVLKLSQRELDCLPPEFTSVVITMYLRGFPEPGSAEAVRDCLENEGLKSLTLMLGAEVASLEAPRAATTDCLESMPPIAEGSLSRVMLGEGEGRATLADVVLGHMMTVMLPIAGCYPADQLAVMGMDQDEQDTMRCVLKETDTGRRLASAMRSGGAAYGLGLYDQARRVCSGGLSVPQTEGGPTESATPPSPPLELNLSQEELDCLLPFDIFHHLLGWDVAPLRPDEIWEIRNCLERESLKALASTMGMDWDGEPSDLTIACTMTSPLQGIYPEIFHGKEGEAALTEATLALLATVALMQNDCSSADELADMGMPPDLHERMMCILRETGGGRELASAMDDGYAAAGLGVFDRASTECSHHVLDKEGWHTPPEVTPTRAAIPAATTVN